MSRVTQDIEFGYLNPREGTETVLNVRYRILHFRSDTLIPVRGRKRSLTCFSANPYRSDTLIPVRGRKLARSVITVDSSRSDTLIPVRGRKQMRILLFPFYSLCSDTLIPVRGRKLNKSFIKTFLSYCSDTLIPVRGRKPSSSKSTSNHNQFGYLNPREGTETYGA